MTLLGFCDDHVTSHLALTPRHLELVAAFHVTDIVTSTALSPFSKCCYFRIASKLTSRKDMIRPFILFSYLHAVLVKSVRVQYLRPLLVVPIRHIFMDSKETDNHKICTYSLSSRLLVVIDG